MEENEVKELMKETLNFVSEIKTVRAKYNDIRKGSKQNFNLFEALVRDKTHHEKYHSNFIGYLLNPKATHDCGTLFLIKFLEHVNREHKINLTIFKDIELEKCCIILEDTNTKGRIDITIESKDWYIFIENKVRSGEGHNQIKDYFEHAKHNFQKSILGIYLTLDGSSPPSISNDKIINLSYKKDIIEWLESCYMGVIRYPHITQAITQYIDIIKSENILNIMEDKEMKEIIEYLEKYPEKAIKIIEHQDDLEKSLVEFIKEKRNLFLNELRNKIEGLKVEGITIERFDSERAKCRYNNFDFFIRIDQAYPEKDDGGKGLWWGLYNDDSGYTPFKCNIGDYKHWDGIRINGINDFLYDKNGSALILESFQNEKLKQDILQQISSGIIDKILTNIK